MGQQVPDDFLDAIGVSIGIEADLDSKVLRIGGRVNRFDSATIGRISGCWLTEGPFSDPSAARHPFGEWVRYSTPEPEGAEYVAVCMPAFSPDTVHRDS